MKYLFLPIVIAFLGFCSGFQSLQAQCVPDTTITASGVYPAVIPPACLGIPYSSVLTVVVPQDSTISTPFGPITVPLDSVSIDSVLGIPPGMNYQCTPPSCVFPGGGSYCIEIFGTPTVADTFDVIIGSTTYIFLLGSPQAFPASTTLEVIVYPGLTGTISTVDANCGAADGSAVVTASGTAPLSYSWSNGDTSAATDNLAPGIYTVDITDANGCSLMLSANIGSLGNAPVLALNSVDWSGCAGGPNGSVDVSISGGMMPYTFTWSNGATTEDLVGVGPGTYDLTVSGANGCATSSTFTVVEPPALQLSVGMVTPVSCFGLSDGTASLNVSGGLGAYTYSWLSTPPQTTSTATALPAGSLGVIVSDSVGCLEDLSLTIMEPDPLLLSLSSTNETQFGANDGTIDLSLSGGTMPFTVSWDNGSTATYLDSLAPGDYIVTVTDGNNCVEVDTVEIVGVNVSIEGDLASGFSSIRLYPNPSNGENIQLVIELVKPQSLTLELLNLRAQVIWKEENPRQIRHSQTLRLTELPSGLYLLRMTSVQGTAFRKLNIVR